MQAGDYFSIPMEDGRLATSQIIWLGNESKDRKFKNIFAFCVLSIGDEKKVPEIDPYLSFTDHRGDFRVVFTAIDNLKSGKWPILHEGSITDACLIDLEFNMAGTLYRRGQPVRVLAVEEYKKYLLLGVSGYALVQKILQQY